MTTRTILALLACSAASAAPATVTGSYRFTTPQTEQSIAEAATVIKVVGDLSQPSGDIGRVIFVPNATKPQEMQELITILRTVADVQKIFSVSSNHAIVLRAPEWQILFSQWIIDQLNVPAGQKPDTTPRELTVGGPDFRGMGHGVRLNFLASMTKPQQQQELLTVLRTVGDVMKVFSYTSSHALVLRAGDVDLQRAEWLIQQLDLPAGHPAGTGTFTAPASDDVTRIFPVPNADGPWMQGALRTVRADLNIKKAFSTTTPANIVVRGTADQVAAVAAWMTSHNALNQ